MKRWSVFVLAVLTYSVISFASASWSGRIIQVSTQKDISLSELIDNLSQSKIVVFGEKHNTPALQQAESLIINDVVKASHQEGVFITAWEFLNYTDQEMINTVYKRFVSGEIDARKFLIETQGSEKNLSYMPVLEVTKALQGAMVGVNLSREAKEPVVQGGIEALDPLYLPPNFSMGGDRYHQRFVEAMMEHASSDKIEHYYAAQCLTDDVMAYTLQRYVDSPLIFLVTGSFHADYGDGVVNRIKVRLNDSTIKVIRFIDAADFTEDQLNDALADILYDKRYGYLADYVYFVNEPGSPRPNASRPPVDGLFSRNDELF